VVKAIVPMLSIRKIGIIGRTYRHLARYRQILSSTSKSACN